jgi:hypothetical protein
MGIFLFITVVQNSSGTHPTSYPMVTRGAFPREKGSQRVKLTTHLHLVLKFENAWSFISICPYAFVAWCLGKYMEVMW